MKGMQDERHEKENKNYYSYAITNLYRIYHKIYIYIYIYMATLYYNVYINVYKDLCIKINFKYSNKG